MRETQFSDPIVSWRGEAERETPGADRESRGNLRVLIADRPHGSSFAFPRCESSYRSFLMSIYSIQLYLQVAETGSHVSRKLHYR